MRKIAVLAALFFAFSAHAQGRMATPATFYFGPSGADSGTACTQAAPCKTMAYVVSLLATQYDMAAQHVTVQAVKSTCSGGACSGGNHDLGCDAKITSGVAVSGVLFGQYGGSGSLLFQGDTSNADNCVVQPATGNCFAAAFGGYFTVQGFKCDAMVSGQDEVAVGLNSNITIGTPFTYGDALNPANDNTVSGGGASLYFTGNYKIEKTLITKTASYSTSNANFMTVSDTTGIGPNWVPHGPCIPPQTVVYQIVNSTTVQLNNFVSCNETNVSVGFSTGGQAHLDIANGGNFLYLTNCGQVPLTVTLTGEPSYYFSFILSDDLGNGDFGVTWSGVAHGYRYWARINATMNACGQAANLPGDVAGVTQTGAQVH